MITFDPSIAFHPSVDAAGNEAIGAWFRALAWSEMYRTGRQIPPSMARKLAPRRVWAALERAGFACSGEDGWTLLDPLPQRAADSTPETPTDGTSELTPRQRAGRAGGLAKAAGARRDDAATDVASPVASLAGTVASPVATDVASVASPSNGVATPLARLQADLDPISEISEKSQRSSPPIVPPLFGGVASGEKKPSKKSRKRPEKIDVEPSLLTVRERAAHDAILRDETLRDTVRWPADTARDLVIRAPGVRDLAVEVHKAGQWLRDNNATRRNGRKFLQGWLDRAQERAPSEPAPPSRPQREERGRYPTPDEKYGPQRLLS